MSSQSSPDPSNTQEAKDWIDQASYEDLFYKWRFEPSGSKWFTGEVGEHFTETIKQRRQEVGPEQHTQTSKKLGW